MVKLPKKLALAAIPTPIIKLDRLSSELGKGIWVKRDDLTGVEFSGNKIRKLEYIFHEILENNCDYVITCGGKQSNHCRAVAAAAAKFGIKCLLVLSGEDDGVRDGNLLLDKLFGAELMFVSESDFSNVDGIMKEAENRLTKERHKPYVIPLGGSTPLGALGYAEAMLEILDFEKKNGVNFDTVSLADGSGGTHAGLLSCCRYEQQILGVSVLAEKSFITNKIAEIMSGMGISGKEGQIHVTDEYIGEGYGIASDDVIEFIKKTAATEALVLDPVYTGKAFYGLVEEIKKGRLSHSENILFVHTGGIFGIFGKLVFRSAQ